LIHELYIFNHNALILDNIGTTYIQWGRSSCTADDTDIVYSGKNVQSIDLGHFSGFFLGSFQIPYHHKACSKHYTDEILLKVKLKIQDG
jgi:hypothetical protein